MTQGSPVVASPPMGRPRKGTDMEQISIRVERALLEEVDVEAERLSAQGPSRVTRADVFRYALKRYLESLKGKGKGKPSK